MTENCALCGGPCNPYDQQTWKEVTGFVGGPKKDAMRLRKDTGRHAHESCVRLASQGHDPSQPTLEDPAPEPEAVGVADVPDGLFEPAPAGPGKEEPDFSKVTPDRLEEF